MLRRLRDLWPHLAWTLLIAGPLALFYCYDFWSRGREIRFEFPWALLLLVLIPWVFISLLLEKKRRARFLFPEFRALLESGPGWKARLLPSLTGIRVCALALLAVAAARPQDVTGRDRTELEGIDIVVALDMSGSMKAADLTPTRLDAAKAVTADFIKRRRTDRIGMVIFGREAYTLCPLTLDYSALTTMLANLKLGDVDSDATAIGNALGTALARLRKSEALSKVIILLTDGSNNSGQITPDQAAEFAKTLGVQIYTILMGQEENAPVEMGVDLFGRKMFGQSSFPVNPELLSKISALTGGKFFRATDRKGLEQSFHEILNALERSRVTDVGILYSEAFPRFLAPALVLLALEIFLGLLVFRRFP